jgi:hypothetical protein
MLGQAWSRATEFCHWRQWLCHSATSGSSGLPPLGLDIIECRTLNIERHLRYRKLRNRMLIRYLCFARYWRSHHDGSISKVTNLRYRTSITGSLISSFHVFDIEQTHFRYRMLISYTILKVALTFDNEGHWRVTVIHIGFNIGYDIALSQYHSLQSRRSLSSCPGSIMLAPKCLSAMRPGFQPLAASNSG